MSHPYISGAGNIASMIDHLRKSFPATIDSSTVKKLGLAPKNESYVINCLQFIGAIDEEGKKTEKAAEVFSQHKDSDFQNAFSQMVEQAYHQLFELHRAEAWTLQKSELITFFRNSDQTSDAIGARQALVFQVLSNKSGKLDDEAAPKNAATTAKLASPKPQKKSQSKPVKSSNNSGEVAKGVAGQPPTGEFGLSVKVEINLPSDATAETYDNIFKSIRKNLING